MATDNECCPVSSIKISSVVPGRTSGNVDYQLTNMDLAMKLHYIKGVYFFESEAVDGMSIDDLKKPMFSLLEMYYYTCGRVRVDEKGSCRPYIKCNDAGVRVIEALVDSFTVEEWLLLDDHFGNQRCLVYDYNQTLRTDIGFSPLLSVQFTWFKCGGISIGLNWAHVLGDAFSASKFINMYTQMLSRDSPPILLDISIPEKPHSSLSTSPKKLLASIIRVDAVGDHWLTTNDMHSFNVTTNQLDALAASVSDGVQYSNFDIISAVIWHSLIKLKGDSRYRAVTIVTSDSKAEIPRNENMTISIVEADFSDGNGRGISNLAWLISNDSNVNNHAIEKEVEVEVEKGGKNLDFLVYGANLTFVDLQNIEVHQAELKRRKPVYVNYTIEGIGSEGSVLVLPGPKTKGENSNTKTVTIMLPTDELSELMNELSKVWEF